MAIMYYQTEGAPSYGIYRNLYKCNNLLIAGTIGSGKSVLLNGIITTLITEETPLDYRYILIDPKRVELGTYRDVSDFCLGYCTEASDALAMLKKVEKEVENRYKLLAKYHLKKWDTELGSRIIVFIDEFADLMISDFRKDIMKTVQRIMQLGRACGISIFAATQCPNRKIIPAEITLNFDNKIALRCISSIESRQIVQVAGAEKITGYGKAIMLSPKGLAEIPVPYVDEEFTEARCDYWRRNPGKVVRTHCAS